MTFARCLASLLCRLAILVAGTHSVIALSIAFFIVNGTLAPGEDMYVDILAPTLAKTLTESLIGATLTAGLAFARHKLMTGTRR